MALISITHHTQILKTDFPNLVNAAHTTNSLSIFATP